MKEGGMAEEGGKRNEGKRRRGKGKDIKNQLNWVLSQVLPIYTLDSRLQYWSIGLHFCGRLFTVILTL